MATTIRQSLKSVSFLYIYSKHQNGQKLQTALQRCAEIQTKLSSSELSH